MKAELTFYIKLPWQQTTYKELQNICVNYKWEDKIGNWIFLYSDIKKVESIIGKKIEIDDFREHSINEVSVDNWKGKDLIEIIELPETYKINTNQKQVVNEETGEFKIKRDTYEIPKELVRIIIRDIIGHMPLNKPVRSRTVAKNIMESLRIDRFHTESGNFDFKKFFGNRKDYKTYFYYPMKVLVDKGWIRHHKSGKVERLK